MSFTVEVYRNVKFTVPGYGPEELHVCKLRARRFGHNCCSNSLARRHYAEKVQSKFPLRMATRVLAETSGTQFYTNNDGSIPRNNNFTELILRFFFSSLNLY